MNLKGKMKKLQTAIVRTGLVIKINSNQFFSNEQKRMITCYAIYVPTVKKCEDIEDISHGKAFVTEDKESIHISFIDNNEERRTVILKNKTKDIVLVNKQVPKNGRDCKLLSTSSMPQLVLYLLDIYKAVSL